MFLSAAFKKVRNILKKIAKWIKKNIFLVLLVVLVVVAIFFPGLWLAITQWMSTAWSFIGKTAGAIATFFAELGPMGAISAALGIGILIDPESFGDALGSIIGGAGDAVGSILSSLGAGNILLFAVGGYLLYKVVTRPRDDDGDRVMIVRSEE